MRQKPEVTEQKQKWAGLRARQSPAYTAASEAKFTSGFRGRQGDSLRGRSPEAANVLALKRSKEGKNCP